MDTEMDCESCCATCMELCRQCCEVMDEAIALHERHMSGAEAASPESQAELMGLLKLCRALCRTCCTCCEKAMAGEGMEEMGE